MKTLIESILDMPYRDEESLSKDIYDTEQIQKIKDYINSDYWEATKLVNRGNLKYSFGTDKNGYYIETNGNIYLGSEGNLDLYGMNYLLQDKLAMYNRVEHKDCPTFYWKSHKGRIAIAENCQHFKTLEGMPKNIDVLTLYEYVGSQASNIDFENHKIQFLKLYNNCSIKCIGHPKIDTLIKSQETSVKLQFKPKFIQIE